MKVKTDQLRTDVSDQDVERSAIRQRLSQLPEDLLYYTSQIPKIGLQRIFRTYSFYLRNFREKF